MTYHEIIHAMEKIVTHLRSADTLCTSPRVIDEIRAAMAVALEVGEEAGKALQEVDK